MITHYVHVGDQTTYLKMDFHREIKWNENIRYGMDLNKKFTVYKVVRKEILVTDGTLNSPVGEAVPVLYLEALE